MEWLLQDLHILKNKNLKKKEKNFNGDYLRFALRDMCLLNPVTYSSVHNIAFTA